MLRHYYISDDLDDLEKIEQELESQGFTQPQIHVLSENDEEIEKHHLHEVEALLKQDIVHSTAIGAAVGIVCAVLLLGITTFLGWNKGPAGWSPFIFLAIVILGFCTWEGGFIGIQKPNVNFERFQDALHKGKHILLVDVESYQASTIDRIVKEHPKLEEAGFGDPTPHWIIRWQGKFKRFLKSMP